MILAIDTATDQASVALVDGDAVLGEYSWRSPGNRSRHLNTVIQELLYRAGFAANAIRGVIVARGPGSFSGIRVGMSHAKGLAFALQCPLFGIASLDVAAYQVSDGSPRVLAAISAGRSQYYVATYSGHGAEWTRTGPYQICSLEECLVAAGGHLVTGDRLDPLLAEAARLNQPLSIPEAARRLRRASFLAELGRRRIEQGDEDEAETIEPLYLRRSSAEEKRAAAQGE